MVVYWTLQRFNNFKKYFTGLLSSRCSKRNSSPFLVFHCSSNGVIENSRRSIPLELQLPDVLKKFKHNSSIPLESCWSYRKFHWEFRWNSSSSSCSSEIPEEFRCFNGIPLELQKIPGEFRWNSSSSSCSREIPEEFRCSAGIPREFRGTCGIIF